MLRVKIILFCYVLFQDSRFFVVKNKFIYLFIHLKGRAVAREIEILLTGSLSKCLQQVRLGRAHTLSQELLPGLLGLRCGWQGPGDLSRHLLLVSWKLDWKQVLDLIAGPRYGVWASQVAPQHLPSDSMCKKIFF